MRYINLIVIHCTATKNGVPVSVEQVRSWHRERGFKDIGYHYLIDVDGTIRRGRKEAQVGAHALGYNSNSIGVCMVGGVGGKDKLNPGVYSDAQMHSLHALVADLMDRYPGCEVVGHRDLSPDLDEDGEIEPHEWTKLCPAFDVSEWKDRTLPK